MISQRQLFLNHLAQTSDSPPMLEIQQAKGIFIKDRNGKSYIDLISGIAVSNLGHGHPAIITAIKKQLDLHTHIMVYGEHIQSTQVRLAGLISDILPTSIDNCFFVNSGSEAIEGAIKLSKRYTGRYEVISIENAYHGSTYGAMSVMGSETYKNAFRPIMPGTGLIKLNDINQLSEITTKTACVIIEPVQGEAGVKIPNPQYMTALRKKCNETGSLLVVDEIQTGLGRTGKMFGFEHYNIVPDIVTMAKGLGGGLPLGAFIAPKEIMHCLVNNPALGHITTFGGNPVSCAASIAVIETLLDNPLLIEEVKAKSDRFIINLTHRAIREIRHKGLLMAMETESNEMNKAIVDRCMENGILTDWFLFAEDSLRIAPPLIIEEDQIDQACEKVLLSIKEVTGN